MQDNQPTKRTAILLFSRSLEEEYKAKSFGLTYPKFKGLYHALLNNTRKAIRESGLPIVESFSWDQFGSSFSQRLADSLRKAFHQGYERVIVVGNDAPSLTADLLLEADALLVRDKPVIGADKRGGTYLIAFDKECFKKADFDAVNWQTDEVFEQLKVHLNPSVLETSLTDVNVKADLLSLVEDTLANLAELERLIKELFDTKSNPEVSIEPYVAQFFYDQNISRGPPYRLLDRKIA